MARAQKGDQTAYRHLLSQVMKTLEGYYRRRIREPENAAEVVQQCLMKVHVVRHTFDATRPFEPWLFAIARTVLIDYFRASGRRIAAELVSDEIFDDAAEDGGAHSQMAFREALGALTEEQRQALQLMKIEGLSVEEAASRLGISESNMKVRMHRALKSLKTSLFE